MFIAYFKEQPNKRMQSDKVPATQEVEQEHGGLLWVVFCRLPRISERQLFGKILYISQYRFQGWNRIKQKLVSL